MSNCKRLAVNLSETLNQELVRTLEKDFDKKNEIIKEAIIVYIEEKKKCKLMEQMKKGYMEMAELSLEISEMGFVSDINDLNEYEARLAECDLPNDNYSEKRRYILC